MNDFEDEQVKCFEEFISAIFRQAMLDEVISLTRYCITDLSVKEFIESGQFDLYAKLLVALDTDKLISKFWESIALQTVKKIEKKNLDITISFLIEDERKAFEKYL